MTGPDHYRDAEDLIDLASHCETPESMATLLAQAQVHAILAHTAAAVEAADRIAAATSDPISRHRALVIRPQRGDDVDPPFPGSPWGRALYGDPA